MTIKVLIADDHEIVRAGLKRIFAEADIKVVAEATTGVEAIAKASRKNLDVVMLDVVMPDMDGLATLRQLKAEQPDLPVLMFSGYDNPLSVARSVALGAAGFLRKGAKPRQLVKAIQTASKDEDLWTHNDLRRVAHAMPEARKKKSAGVEIPLTKREQDVLTRITRGMNNKEIGIALDISYETVKEHVQNILRKLGLVDRTQAAVWAVRKELS